MAYASFTGTEQLRRLWSRRKHDGHKLHDESGVSHRNPSRRNRIRESGISEQRKPRAEDFETIIGERFHKANQLNISLVNV